jgi:hypothetical protein
MLPRPLTGKVLVSGRAADSALRSWVCVPCRKVLLEERAGELVARTPGGSKQGGRAILPGSTGHLTTAGGRSSELLRLS